MKGTLATKAVISLLLSLVWSVPAGAQTLNSFTATYKGGSSTCGTTYSIQGKEPATAGAYPVLAHAEPADAHTPASSSRTSSGSLSMPSK